MEQERSKESKNAFRMQHLGPFQLGNAEKQKGHQVGAPKYVPAISVPSECNSMGIKITPTF
jgi:hypothetical protein